MTPTLGMVGLASAGQVVDLESGATYLTSGVTVPDGVTLRMNGATIRRETPGGPLLTVGAGCTIVGGTVDGADVGGSADKGLNCGADVTLHDLTVHNHPDTGVQAVGGAPKIVDVTAHSNGKDGIYLLNTVDAVVRDVTVYGNGRTGLVVTTWDGTSPDPALSDGVRIGGVRAYGNAYNDVNCEQVTAPTVTRVRADGMVTFGHSPDATLSDVRAGRVRGSDADRPMVERLRLAAPFEALWLDGASPSVRDVTVDPSGSLSGNMVVVQPSDRRARMDGVALRGCHNGFLLSVGPGFWARNLWIEQSVNTRFRWVLPDSTVGSSQARTVRVDNGTVTA